MSLITQAIISGVVAGLGLFLGNQFFKWWNKPRLQIMSENYNGDFEDIEIRVKNTGKKGAKKCTGKIEFKNLEVSDLKDSTPQGPFLTKSKFNEFKDAKLQWSSLSEDETKIDINPDDWEILKIGDIPRDSSADNHIDIQIVKNDERLNCRLLNPAKAKGDLKYEGVVKVSSMNSNLNKREFEIREKGNQIKFFLL